jgi:signal transduction histidine kinase
VDIRLKNNYRLEITFAFALFAFVIILIILAIGMVYFTKFSQNEFKSNVLLSAKNIEYNFHQKELSSRNALEAVTNGTILKNFTPNSEILSIIFKTLLISNDDFKSIVYESKKLNFFCKKDKKIYCNYGKFIKKNKLSLFTKITTKNTNSLIIQTSLEGFLKSLPNDKFRILFIDKNGKILYSNFIKSKTVFDMFSSDLATKMINENKKFITNDIYVDKLGKYKLIFMQNKKFLHKQKLIARDLAITMFLVALLLSIPFGFFFSKPLYEFYKLLDERVNEEIEKNREKEQMLMHQSKLASLGEMLGNIAHQWRHPITRISLLVQNLNRAYEFQKLDDKYMQKFYEKVNEQINYMSNTIDDFTGFFKKDKKKQNFYVKDVINDALKLIEGRLKNIKIVKKYNFDMELYGYKTEFSQVILNILNNAIDVLNERNIVNKEIIITLDKNLISIEDNAGGIDEKIKDKIFEPYFTTKFQSQGTGIGLYMSKIIITKHFDAKLLVENSKIGAVFKIILPKST